VVHAAPTEAKPAAPEEAKAAPAEAKPVAPPATKPAAPAAKSPAAPEAKAVAKAVATPGAKPDPRPVWAQNNPRLDQMIRRLEGHPLDEGSFILVQFRYDRSFYLEVNGKLSGDEPLPSGVPLYMIRTKEYTYQHLLDIIRLKKPHPPLELDNGHPVTFDRRYVWLLKQESDEMVEKQFFDVSWCSGVPPRAME
jgi:hypothetical protein